MSTIKVVNIQHPDSVEPNLVLQTDGDTVFASGLTVSGTFDIANDLTVSGNTGLGTSSPTSKLHVVDTTTNLQLESTADSSSGKIDFIGKDASSNSYRTLTIDTSSTGEINIETDPDNGGYSTDKSIIFKQAGSEKARIDNSGNIGIGTSSPGRALHVLNSTSIVARFESTATNFGGIELKDANTTADFKVQLAAIGDALKIDTGGTEKMRITSGGNAGIGTSSPEGRMHVRADGDETKALLNLQNRDTGSSAASQIAFFNGAVDLSDNRYAYIRCTKTGTNGNFLTFGTNSTGNPPGERIRILAEGGLTFNGDTAAANALDDYEEGTWTPVFEGATTAGSYTYSTQVGKYTKIGNKVTVTVTLLNITTVSAGSGTLNISGLPFAQAGDYSVGAMYMAHFDLFASTVNLSSRIDGSGSHILALQTRDAASASAVTVTDKVNDSADIIATITYFTNA